MMATPKELGSDERVEGRRGGAGRLTVYVRQWAGDANHVQYVRQIVG